MNTTSPTPPPGRPASWARSLTALILAALAVRFVPSWWCARDAGAWLEGDPARWESLAAGVESLVLEGELSAANFHNPDPLFNGEWLFGSYFAAGVGFAQIAVQQSAARPRNLERALRCVDRLLGTEARAFDTGMWEEDPIASLSGPNGHAAYLGYLNLLLGLARVSDPQHRHAQLNDRVSEALARRLRASPIGLLETYPHQVYPVDNAMVIGSLALHQRATGTDHREILRAWVETVRARYLDPATGLLIQSVYAQDGKKLDEPRGSGSTLGLLGIQYADPALAADLYRAMRGHLFRQFLGFGAVREYPPGVPGRGDIDSGPVVLGIGLSPTGFALAGARMHGDEETFSRLFASAHLFGAPVEGDRGRAYVSGGSLGNAILLAMLTVPRSEVSIPSERP